MIPIRDLNPTRGPTLVTWLLVLAAAAVFFFVQPTGDSASIEFLYEQATIPCEIVGGEPLTIEEASSGRCDDRSGPRLAPGKRVHVSLLTSIFLHGSLMHLLGNLWVLSIFGNNVEDDLGWVRFAAFYVAAGVAAGLGHVALHPADVTPVVGASGAIAGVMGAYFVLHPWARVVSIVPPLFFLPFRVPAAVYLLVWFALQFALANQDTNIAWEAHAVGFVFGVVVAGAMRAGGWTRRPRARRRAA